jgi:esterase/lipase superfamily enzyme
LRNISPLAGLAARRDRFVRFADPSESTGGDAMHLIPHQRSLAIACVLICATFAAGCGGKPQLMRTPNLYAGGTLDPFADVPPALQNNRVDVLYLTDRAQRTPDAEPGDYGYRRSRSMAFGITNVSFGEDVSWEQLVKASRTDKRDIKLPILIKDTNELVRFPPTPRVVLQTIEPTTQPTTSTSWRMVGDERDAEQLAAEAAFHAELSKRLSVTPVKEVYIFIHGYANTFDNAIETIAQVWHFMGRQGVPFAYSWPAGSTTGLLRGYTYDRESSEFTVFHLKQAIRMIAAMPEVERINIISHSRGTDVTVNALRELHMEIAGSGRSTREVLKLGTVVLAAPDIDLDVMIQKFTTVRLGQVPERFAMYVCENDKALGFSNWLFSGMQRLGKLRAQIFSPEELETMRASKTVQIIDARVSNAGAFGHDYFHSNPAVSSDLILLMRYKLAPGPSTGRPLRIDKSGFWIIDDTYPKKESPQ